MPERKLQLWHRSAGWYLMLISILLLPPVSTRIIQLWETGSEFKLYDFRGVTSDFLAVFGVFIIVLLLLKAKTKFMGRVFGFLIVLIWSIITYGNFEHIENLGTTLSLAYGKFLFDFTFVSSSAVNANRPLLLAFTVLIPSVIFWKWRQFIPSWSAIGIAVVPACVLLLILFFWNLVSTGPLWRQQNFALDSLHWATQLAQMQPAKNDIRGLYPADLDSSSISVPGRPNTNVLIVIMEGLSGAHLDSIASLHGLEGPRPSLPNLDRLARENVSFANFINHQRQTNRGVYPLLCGDLPKLITAEPKMTEFGLAEKNKHCLPEVLRKNGYSTSFIQAAPLAFMDKDKFMPKAGFESVYGRRWFNKMGKEYTGWGIDDAGFFDHAKNYIENELIPHNKPWFLTLLTSGTHHPFSTPESHKSQHASGTFSNAVDYLNFALKDFIQFLESSEIRENTLVIFTSDESLGRRGLIDVDENLLSQAFGLLTVLTPNRDSLVIDEPFMQMDIAVSVLDYLGYLSEIGDMGGRSVFRSYASKRSIPFANTYMRMSSVFTAENELTVCREDFITCRQFNIHGKYLASSKRTQTDVGPENIQLLKDIVGQSLYTNLPP